MVKHKYTMSINLNILNHLGIKLYSNVPAVLSEVVANSWDADATSVDIEIEPNRITITDNGHGMTFDDINSKYLHVGYKRREHDVVLTAKHNRPVMGRKGIGKLSLFSIADTVAVETVKGTEKRGFVMSATEIEEQISQEKNDNYHPIPLQEDQISLDVTAVQNSPNKGATRIVLTGLKKGVSQAPGALRKRLARRFSIIGTKDFMVSINGDSVDITDRDYFHKLHYLWHYGKGSEKYIDLCDSEKLEYYEPGGGKIEVKDEDGATAQVCQVTGWIGTVKEASDVNAPDDNLNKIVIMVRGKLAQEDILEDFTEGGLYTKYIIGEIHADFLDSNNQDDIATSNRQEIIKDDPRYIAIQDWVQTALKNIESQWRHKRNERGEKEARQNPAIDKWLSRLGKDKRKQARAMFGKIGELTLEEHQKKELYKSSVLAFESLKYKDSLSALDNVSPENLQEFAKVFAELEDIATSLYYQIVQERLQIINVLHDKAESNDLEKVIQRHLYDHLWLLNPSWDRATDSPLMEQNVRAEFDNIDADLTDDEKRGRFDIKYKMTSGTHVIIELKRAGRKLRSTQLQDQVDRYRNALRKLIQETGRNEPVEVICLVGQRPEDWATVQQEEESRRSMEAKNTRVILYQELIEDAYRSYEAFLKQNRKAGRVYNLIRDIDNEN